MAIWSQSYSHRELERVCAILAKSERVSIVLNAESTAAPEYDIAERTITIGTRDVYIYGVDKYVGAIVHEIGHVRYTPVYKAKSNERQVLNMLEDERIEDLLYEDYPGADKYLGANSRRAYDLFERYLRTPTPYGTREAVGYVAEADLDELYIRTLLTAILTAHARAPLSKTGVKEADQIAVKIASELRGAWGATPKEISAATKRVCALLGSMLPKEPPKMGDLKMQVMAKESGGHGTTYSPEVHTEPEEVPHADKNAVAASLVLRKQVLRTLRENERTRYEGGKKRGLLDKKRLHATARDNYRVYRKRILPKGKKYACMVLLDTSGSMWGPKIGLGMESALTMLRTMRGLGYPCGLAIYGKAGLVVVDPRDTYTPGKLIETLRGLTGQYYYSGSNETHLGLKVALPRLIATGAGRSKLMVVITDGGLDHSDVKASHEIIESAKGKHGVHSMIYYVETGTQRILGDPAREVTIRHAADLPAACIGLMRKVAYSEVDAS